MSGDGGFFARLARQATGREPLVRLRAPQPFEAASLSWPADLPVEMPASWSGSAAPTPTPARAVPDGPAVGSVPATGRTAPVPVPVAPDRSRADRTLPAKPPEAAPAVADRIAARAEPAGPAHREPDAPPAIADPSAADPPAATPPAPARPPDTARAAAVVPPAPPAPASAARRPAPTPAPAAVPDLVRLLRERLGPALIARRAVEPGERLVFVDRPAKAGAPPRPGTAEVRTGPVRPASATPPGTAEDAPPAGDVHLHIDRVVVTRAPTPPPAPAPPAKSTVDHAAYLARRREGR